MRIAIISPWNPWPVDSGSRQRADLIIQGVERAIAAKTVTYDFERLMPDAKLLRCSEFGDAIISHM